MRNMTNHGPSSRDLDISDPDQAALSQNLTAINLTITKQKKTIERTDPNNPQFHQLKAILHHNEGIRQSFLNKQTTIRATRLATSRHVEMPTPDESADPIDSQIISHHFKKKFETPHLALLHVRYFFTCLLYTSPSPRDLSTSRMPSSA